MPHVSDSVNAEFRRKLAELEASRRQLVFNAFVSYGGETGEMISLLISEASPVTLAKLEALLAKGGQG